MNAPQPIHHDMLLEFTGGEDDGAREQYLSFLLGDEEYAVDILKVQEIKGWSGVTPIPNCADYVKGVINLRGTIVPVVDLRLRFGLPASEYGPLTVVIVLRIVGGGRGRIMGVVVDAVADVHNLPVEELKPPPTFGASVDTEYLRGLATVEERMLILLDIDRLLSSGELAVGDEGGG
ncbi:MAG TPA: purine-binding chemotaxis protein CheW [Thiotrichales bacterium]|nr:purine-binding chemotaxis protein CheW [Thiotrichales bacterium]